MVAFSLPGAFTPTCSNTQCPSYDQAHDEMRRFGVDTVYCISANDAFVMFRWTKHIDVTKVKMIPEGNGDFTRRTSILVRKEHLGFGCRRTRYAMVVHGGVVKKWFEEPGINDEGADADPYETTDPDTVLAYLRTISKSPGIRHAAQ